MATVDSTVLYNWSSIKEKKLGYLTQKRGKYRDRNGNPF